MGLFRKISYHLKTRWNRFVFNSITHNKNAIKCLGFIDIRNPNIKIGEGSVIYPGVIFSGDGCIKMGKNVFLGDQVQIFSSKNGGVTIGDDTRIAANSYIIDCEHVIGEEGVAWDKGVTSLPVIIGKNVWIGQGVTILRGSVIEDGAIIGAKSLVKGVCTKGGVYCGTPAKRIKDAGQ